MKKVLFSLVIVLLTCSYVQANTVYVKNFTNCSFTLSLNGGCNGPSVVPPTPSGTPIVYNCNFNCTAAKVVYSNGSVSDQVNLVYSTMTSGTSSIVPPCMTTPYNCTWIQNSPTPGDVTIIIYP